ncbi:uncharacterized protein LOC108596599 [Drosophila busckii]|uniref:uncharacterized protein LOC108596599 n=1 Tax=Drosophila busckii TaxID=30019 RepID=UPI00083EC97B|nr:uncharacterized protein LOC108596599 [Drosophila busckii]
MAKLDPTFLQLPKFLCCIELFIGVILVVIYDVLFAALVIVFTLDYEEYSDPDRYYSIGDLKDYLFFCRKELYGFWICFIIIHAFHMCSCILAFINVFIKKPPMLIPYLITGILRYLIHICFLIFQTCELFNHTNMYIIGGFIVAPAVYEWATIYSQYKEMGGDVP